VHQGLRAPAGVPRGALRTPPGVALIGCRGVDRDGPRSTVDWPRYEAEEDQFFSADPVWARADLVADGAPGLPHDPETEYVRLR